MVVSRSPIPSSSSSSSLSLLSAALRRMQLRRFSLVPKLVVAALLLALLYLSSRWPSSPFSAFSTASSSMSSASSELLAINVCLLPPPSHPISVRAHSVQAHILALHPSEYVFSSTRFAHVTVVQAFILRADLPALLAALKADLAGRPPPAPLALRMEKELVPGAAMAGLYVPSIAIAPSPALSALHARVLAAVRSFRVSTASPALSLEDDGAVAGMRAAFYREAHEEAIGQGIVQYVRTFEERSAGERYYPHVSVGVLDAAALAALQERERHSGGEALNDSVEPWTADRLHVLQLGDWGTVRQRLDEIAL